MVLGGVVFFTLLDMNPKEPKRKERVKNPPADTPHDHTLLSSSILSLIIISYVVLLSLSVTIGTCPHDSDGTSPGMTLKFYPAGVDRWIVSISLVILGNISGLMVDPHKILDKIGGDKR